MNPVPAWQREKLLHSPLYFPLHPLLERMVAGPFPNLTDLNHLLDGVAPAITVERGAPIRFVPQAIGKLAFEAQYEPRCYLNGEVQTRHENWHDLLNALVWMTFPKAKRSINARHYHALCAGRSAAAGMSSMRGAIRDTNTLLDESGVVIPYADEALASLLRNFRWKELFWLERDHLLSRMGFFIFGHGLYEKALRPYVGLTGQGLLIPVEAAFFDWPLEERLTHLDQLVADYLAAPQHCQSTRELHPLPLLGVPGWAVENEAEGYYDNTDYFRPGRQRRAQASPLRTAPSSVAG